MAVLEQIGEELKLAGELLVGRGIDQVGQLCPAYAVIVLREIAVSGEIIFHFRRETCRDVCLLIGSQIVFGKTRQCGRDELNERR